MEESTEVKVSVIMPSLNVAEYIEECLLSALNQTLEELEIICIDAKSTDGTWEFLNGYVEKQDYGDKIRLLQSDVKSYGYQVNMGIREAKGKYIAILETDDYIEKDMYQELYVLAELSKADMVKADYVSFFEVRNGERIYQTICLWEHDRDYYNQVLSPKKVGHLYSHDYSIWKGIYNREFLIKNQIRFNESKGAAFQDIGFMQLVLACAERVVYTDKSFYRYRIGREMSSVNSVKSLMFAYQEFYRLLSEPDLYKKFVFLEGLYRRMAYVLLVEYPKVLKMVGYDVESEYIKPYYEWFQTVILDAIEQKKFQLESLDVTMQRRLSALLYEEDIFVSEIKENDVTEETFFQYLLDKRVYIFGAGRIGERIVKSLLIREIIPVCVCDNNETLWGRKLYIVDILSPEESVSIYKTDTEKKVFLIANKYHYDEIEKQLRLFSISKDEIIESI